MQKRSFTVKSSPLRLDRFLHAQKIQDSMRGIRRLLDQGAVFVNQRPVYIASYEVTSGDQVSVLLPTRALPLQAAHPQITLTKADFLWQDTGSVFFNKPTGLLTQETRKERHRHVVPLLKAQLGYDPLYLCHRLDKDTSGVLLLAKTPEKLAYFMELFKTHSLAKTYWALVYGVPSIPQWQVKAPLSEVSPATGQVSVVSQGGRWAKTGFRLLAQNPTLGVSLIECSPQTGRTHQIRVHLEHSGYPLLGDVRYTKGARPLALPPHALYLCKAHHMLHAYGLQLPLGPATDHQRICAPPPKTFLTLAHMLQLAYPYHSPPFDCATVS